MQSLSSQTRSINSFDGYGKNPDFNGSLEVDSRAIISLANEKSSCFSILEAYKVKLVESASSNGWTHKATCPFKSHKGGNERDASFGYNSKEDRFYCFGCRKSGRAVDFIAAYDGRPKLEIANEILQSLGVRAEEVYEHIPDDTNDRITELLVDFSIYTESILDKFRNDDGKISLINNIVYCLDMYIMHGASKRFMDLEEFIKRIEYYKERLSRIE